MTLESELQTSGADFGANTNGASPKSPPSLEDYWLRTEEGAPNILIEMMTTALESQKFIPRAIVSPREAAALQRFSNSVQIWKNRTVDPGMIVWTKLAYSIAIQGRGRQQVVDMYGGLSGRIREGFMGMGNNRPSEPRQRG